jgi:hypothetical protein
VTRESEFVLSREAAVDNSPVRQGGVATIDKTVEAPAGATHSHVAMCRPCRGFKYFLSGLIPALTGGATIYRRSRGSKRFGFNSSLVPYHSSLLLMYLAKTCIDDQLREREDAFFRLGTMND